MSPLDVPTVRPSSSNIQALRAMRGHPGVAVVEEQPVEPDLSGDDEPPTMGEDHSVIVTLAPFGVGAHDIWCGPMRWSDLATMLMAESEREPDHTVAEWAAETDKAKRLAAKSARGYFVLAQFRGVPDQDGVRWVHRSEATLEQISGATFDIEGAEVPADETILSAFPEVEAVLTTTRSSRPDAPRRRLTVPFARPLEPNEGHRVLNLDGGSTRGRRSASGPQGQREG